ncbi:LOW QUALITY PROTEIN: peroxisome proliferator-activated receptor gamma coactivator 1-beta [Labeo rohita]|nr:LOW QUALITY PROTEIN: peroxisome proliferator-activated receptor gamma coactivator 1-beta [Labeo rohita]
MADCASLLDEELSSFVFNYLTENSGSQYGEEEVCSDRLDADFPDFDLSQLDASDFDSVNCLSELHWCNEHSDHSPASIQYSGGDSELFEEENAALLAALTDSLDGIVEDGVGGLSVFPSLGDDPEEGEEEDDDLPLDSEPLPGSLSPETEDPSLLKKLLLSPPNVPAGLDSHKDGGVHRHSSRSQHVKPVRPVLKKDKSSTQERKPRPVRPSGRLCTELHRHLTTAQEAEDAPSADTEEEEEEEDEEDSDSEEEEEESSGSEGESMVCVEPAKPQFSSEKELHSVVELIKYMHTYCLPIRKQASWDRKEREASARKAKPESSQVLRNLPVNSQKAAPQTSKPRVPFTRRREIKAHSLLKELLEAVSSFDVSKPYRMHSPPYIHCRGAVTRLAADLSSSSPARQPKVELKDSDCESSQKAAKRPKSPEPEEGSFSVRRSRRLASFPSRFAKKVRVNCGRSEPSAGQSNEEENAVKHPPTEPPSDSSQKSSSHKASEAQNPCCSDEKRSCLCLPLASKSNGDAQYANKPFEQTLSVELCGTAGLTPPTTPPHKPVEDELFKPDGKAELTTKSSCLARAHIRKLPEQTELYAQLRRMGQTGDMDSKSGTQRAYGDHDYCLLGLGESCKTVAAALGSQCRVEVHEEEEVAVKNGEMEGQEERLLMNCQQRTEADLPVALSTPSPEQTGQPSPVRSPTPELDAQSPVSCSPPSPGCKLPFSDESSETCHGAAEKRSKTKCGQENDVNKCQVIYIHNLPSSVTQSMLRKRFEAFGRPEDCKVVIKNEERCGVITLRPAQNAQTSRHRWDSLGPSGGSGSRRFGRKRYIDLDEAGPGPVKSKYDALDFDALLKEAQRSLHR